MSRIHEHVGSHVDYFPLVNQTENGPLGIRIPGKHDRDLDRDLKELKQLNKVTITSCVLGQGSYGTVYEAKYNGIRCAAKQLDLCDASKEVKQARALNFKLECLQHSKLRDPSIVTMLGIFYPKKQTIPFLVMELMEYNLTQLLERTPNMIMYVKLSILQDVSRGLRYLHTQNIVHQALYSDNILFTKGLIAKIGDFKTGTAAVSDQLLMSVRRNKRNDFLPYPHDFLKYDMPLNVFSFGCVICHVITQIWPCSNDHHNDFIKSAGIPALEHRKLDTKPKACTDDWSVNKHQSYIDQIDDSLLRHLVEACLQCNPENRPLMSQIYDRITGIMRSEFEFM